MRNLNFVLSGVVALALASCSGEKKEGYVIEGTIAGMDNGTVYLKQYVDKNFVDADSAVVTGGHFKFTGVASEPMAYALTTVKDSRRPLVFFLDNDNMTVTMDESSKEISVSGSPVNDFYFSNLEAVGRQGFSIDSLVAANPASAVAAYWVMKDFAWQLDLEQMKKIRGLFDKSLEGSFYVKGIDSYIERLSALQVGAVAPDFTLPDTEGNEVSLSSFRGKYVLVDFWASWCPDCRKENPNIVAAYNRFKDKNFTVLGVSLDRKKEQWLEGIEKDGLTWTHVSDLKDWKSEVAQLYAIRWIPTSYLIGPDGVIIAVSLEGEQLMNKLEELLG